LTTPHAKILVNDVVARALVDFLENILTSINKKPDVVDGWTVQLAEFLAS